MKRFLKEPWIIGSLLWLGIGFTLSLFESIGTLRYEPDHWILFQSQPGQLTLSAGDGFNWIFGSHFQAHYIGFESWSWANLFPAPDFIPESSHGEIFRFAIPFWLPFAISLAAGAILHLRRTNRVRSADQPC
ncbi:MAG: hypothetical protein HKN23_06860 [Verrucomicrobiales bacterium]|nr:hypothetical protein [Verrucomicrobiales bacterium]